MKEWVNGSKSLHIFIFGKTGSGKSSLLNTLLEAERAEEGASIYSKTKAVQSHSDLREMRARLDSWHLTINDVEVTIWDSPGLRDPFTDEKKTIEEIEKNCKNVDLFIYCTPFNQTRITQDDFDSISALSDGLGKDIWEKGLIALTFANEVNLPQTHLQGSIEQQFAERLSDWKEALICAITKTGVKKEVAEGIPIVPTSYHNTPIPGSRMKDWFLVCWGECLKRIRFLSLPAFLKLHKENAVLMEEAQHTLKGFFISSEFNVILKLQDSRAGPEHEGTIIMRLCQRDPEAIINTIAQLIFGPNPSGLIFKKLD